MIGTTISGELRQACYNVSIINNALIVVIIIGVAIVVYSIASKGS